MMERDFLRLVFSKNETYEWTVDEGGMVTVLIENKGAFHWIFQKFFGKPRVSQVHMEEFGSFIWKELDGRKTVLEIGEVLKEEFGEKAVPLYERLALYLRQLKAYGFIVLK